MVAPPDGFGYHYQKPTLEETIISLGKVSIPNLARHFPLLDLTGVSAENLGLVSRDEVNNYQTAQNQVADVFILDPYKLVKYTSMVRGSVLGIGVMVFTGSILYAVAGAICGLISTNPMWAKADRLTPLYEQQKKKVFQIYLEQFYHLHEKLHPVESAPAKDSMAESVIKYAKQVHEAWVLIESYKRRAEKRENPV